MKDIITAISNTPIPTIFVIVGLLLIILALGVQLKTSVVTTNVQNRIAGIVGTLLIVIGGFLYIYPLLYESKNINRSKLVKFIDERFVSSEALREERKRLEAKKALIELKKSSEIVKLQAELARNNTVEVDHEALQEENINVSKIAVEAEIEYPHDGMNVKRKAIIKGRLLSSHPVNSYLVIESVKYGGIYPQGKIQVDPNNKFFMPVIYGSTGYKYKTYIVVTNNIDSSKIFENERFRKYGMTGLPKDTKVVGHTVIYTVVK